VSGVEPEAIQTIRSDEEGMAVALALAQQASVAHEVPVGAVVVREQRIIGRGYNQPIRLNDPTAHAEVLALRDAASRCQDYRLAGSTVYVSLEPCPMCMSALIHARVSRVVFGAFDPRQGAAGTAIALNMINPLRHDVDCFGGVMAEECGALLKDFFKQKR